MSEPLVTEQPATGRAAGGAAARLPAQVQIRDCGPRDGLQGERVAEAAARAELVHALDRAGVPEIEVAAFVSPKAVPAMAGAADVVEATRSCSAEVWGLVPNRRGAELALGAGISNLTVTISASPVYSEKNVGMTVDESIDQIRQIVSLAGVTNSDVVISCSFGSPFGDTITPSQIASLADRLEQLQVGRVTLADTTGTATPRRVAAVLDHTGPTSSGAGIGLHLHDTRGTALLNAHEAMRHGISRFDTSIGGLGGSPFAPGAGGNLATEDLVLLLDDLGITTGIDLEGLLSAGGLAAELIGHDLPSRVAAAGPLPPF